jgi:hypothetical protein
MWEHGWKSFKESCLTIWRERELILSHRPIFIAFGIAVFLATAVISVASEYLWFSSAITSRDNEIRSRDNEIRIKNATIENLLNSHSSPVSSDSTAVQTTKARLRVRYIPNSVQTEVLQSENIHKQTSLGLPTGEWTLLVVVFDRPIPVDHFRVNIEGPSPPSIDIRTRLPRFALIIFEGPLANRIVDVEAD